MASGGTHLGQSFRVGGGNVHFFGADGLPIPRLLKLSARKAGEMRKSPQSKKPLYIVLPAQAASLAWLMRIDDVDAKLTNLRVVHKVTLAQGVADLRARSIVSSETSGM